MNKRTVREHVNDFIRTATTEHARAVAGELERLRDAENLAKKTLLHFFVPLDENEREKWREKNLMDLVKLAVAHHDEHHEREKKLVDPAVAQAMQDGPAALLAEKTAELDAMRDERDAAIKAFHAEAARQREMDESTVRTWAKQMGWLAPDETIDSLRSELADYERTLTVVRAATKALEPAYKKANGIHENVLPDTGRMCAWTANEMERLKTYDAAVAELRRLGFVILNEDPSTLLRALKPVIERDARAQLAKEE